MKPIIRIENLSKQYRLGTVGTGTLRNDFKRWWCRMRGMEDPFLKIGETNIRSRKGDSEYVWALKDINLEVKQGEVLGIIGGNGAGKSTLLKILSRVTGPTTGRIDYNGRIGSLLEVGTGFHPELTGRENIFLNGAILGMTKAEINRKLDEIVNFAGVERYIDTPVKRYSSGMIVRLGFAVAAHLEPEILVVDEVLAVGDAEFQKKAIGKMQDVSKNEGRTILFVSHNMAAIQKICSEAVLMKDGTIGTKCSVDHAIEKYLKGKRIFNSGKLKDRIINSIKPIAYFTDIKIFNKNKEIVDTLICGEKYSFELSYEAKYSNLKLSFNIGIYNSVSEKLVHLGSSFTNNTLNTHSFSKTGSVYCLIEKLPFVQGTYFVNLSLYNQNERVDSVLDCLSFAVIEGDFFGTGKLPFRNENKYFVDHNWFIKDEYAS